MENGVEGYCLGIDISDLTVFEVHDRVFALRSLVKGLTEPTTVVYERYHISIMPRNLMIGSTWTPTKKYYLYISKLTDYQLAILKDLGYNDIRIDYFKRDKWSKKLNLN